VAATVVGEKVWRDQPFKTVAELVWLQQLWEKKYGGIKLTYPRTRRGEGEVSLCKGNCGGKLIVFISALKCI
jgi:hypothetical protein